MKKQPLIALGTWSWGTGAVGGDQVFGNHLETEELKPVFDEAMANGLNLWDTAVVYGMGASETVLSAFTYGCRYTRLLGNADDLKKGGCDEVCRRHRLLLMQRVFCMKIHIVYSVNRYGPTKVYQTLGGCRCNGPSVR